MVVVLQPREEGAARRGLQRAGRRLAALVGRDVEARREGGAGGAAEPRAVLLGRHGLRSKQARSRAEPSAMQVSSAEDT